MCGRRYSDCMQLTGGVGSLTDVREVLIGAPIYAINPAGTDRPFPCRRAISFESTIGQCGLTATGLQPQASGVEVARRCALRCWVLKPNEMAWLVKALDRVQKHVTEKGVGTMKSTDVMRSTDAMNLLEIGMGDATAAEMMLDGAVQAWNTICADTRSVLCCTSSKKSSPKKIRDTRQKIWSLLERVAVSVFEEEQQDGAEDIAVSLSQGSQVSCPRHESQMCTPRCVHLGGSYRRRNGDSRSVRLDPRP